MQMTTDDNVITCYLGMPATTKLKFQKGAANLKSNVSFKIRPVD